MSENLSAEVCTNGRDAVCIDAGMVYDSCSDRDCLQNLRVIFPEAIQRSIIDTALSAKVKNVTVLNVLIDVQSVPFNLGFYSVDMTYYFEITAEVTTAQGSVCTVNGVATAEKKAILYGSDGNVRVFDSTGDCEVSENGNMPVAKVQVVDPICLDSKLMTCTEAHMPVKIPDCILNYFKTACFSCCEGSDSMLTQKDLYVTLGLFSIVQLQRRVQMLVPYYDFCLPDKDCSQTVTTESNPCDYFSQIKFPTEQFFPRKLDIESDCSCGCN